MGVFSSLKIHPLWYIVAYFLVYHNGCTLKIHPLKYTKKYTSTGVFSGYRRWKYTRWCIFWLYRKLTFCRWFEFHSTYKYNHMVWVNFTSKTWFIFIFVFVKIVTGQVSVTRGNWNIYVYHFGTFWKILKQFWLHTTNNLKMSKWKYTNLWNQPV